ncbi:MAG TPA: nuclear transport factor 2 family protein [Anaeromyxobacter sp.]
MPPRTHRRPLLPVAAAIAAALGAACATAPKAEPPGAARTFSYQALSLRDAALNAHDADAAARVYAVDALVVDADSGQIVLRGRDQIREAHARFLAACPRARIEATERAYAEETRLVLDVVRTWCDRPPPIDGWARYQITGGSIVGVLKHAVPAFGELPP